MDVIPGKPALLVTERFDQAFAEDSRTLDGQPVPARLHQEDLCQALGFVPEHKYEEQSGRGHLERVADLIRRHSTSAVPDLERLWECAVFAYVIDNCDMHLKNISLLRSWAMKRVRQMATETPEAIERAAHSLKTAGAEGATAFAETILPGVEARSARLLAG